MSKKELRCQNGAHIVDVEPEAYREYYVAAPRRRRRRKGWRMLPLILCMMLFASGFVLGRVFAAEDPREDTTAFPQALKATAILAPLSPASGDDTETPAPQVETPVLPVASAPMERAPAPLAAAPLAAAPLKESLPAPPADSSAQVDMTASHAAPAPSVTGNKTGTETADWSLILVNKESFLPEDFAIPELTELKNGHRIDSRAYPDLQRMMDAARASGLNPVICSSYRTWEKQEKLFENKTRYYMDQGFARAEAEEKASFWVARPGTSEHQAGLAVDIVAKEYQLLDEGQALTDLQKWLMANCADYGFILRYPTEKSDLTGVGFEPWHYRYVGEAAARAITSQGICLEEYTQQTT